MDKMFINRKIENNPFFMAQVEIIIPFHGEQAHVSRLIDSIFKTIYTNRYLITLVDDGSINSTFVKEFDKTPGVRCLRQEHKGFGSAVNLALQTPYFNKNITWVCIMQSDVLVENNNWLSNMGNTINLLKSSGVKMVSPLTNNPMIDSPVLVGKKGETKKDHILTEGFLPMYCTLAHRELFNRVGLLKEYPYAGLEAEEYALRMNSMGFKQAICGTSWVNHIGGVTLANFSKNTKVQQILQKTREEYDLNLKKEVLVE